MIIPPLPSIPDPFNDPRLKEALLEMAKAVESIKKQYADIRPQMERQSRQMSEALREATVSRGPSSFMHVPNQRKPKMEIPYIPPVAVEKRSDQLETIINRLDGIASTLKVVVTLLQTELNRRVQAETIPRPEERPELPSER